MKQGIVGLHSAPCLKALLQLLPTILQKQYNYEKPLLINGEQLMHSGVLKCLTNLALILKLDEILCSNPGEFSFLQLFLVFTEIFIRFRFIFRI